MFLKNWSLSWWMTPSARVFVVLVIAWLMPVCGSAEALVVRVESPTCQPVVRVTWQAVGVVVSACGLSPSSRSFLQSLVFRVRERPCFFRGLAMTEKSTKQVMFEPFIPLEVSIIVGDVIYATTVSLPATLPREEADFWAKDVLGRLEQRVSGKQSMLVRRETLSKPTADDLPALQFEKEGGS